MGRGGEREGKGTACMDACTHMHPHIYAYTHADTPTHMRPLTKMLGTGFLSPFIANTT